MDSVQVFISSSTFQNVFVNGHFGANNSAKVEENDYDTIDSAIEDLTLKIHMTK